MGRYITVHADVEVDLRDFDDEDIINEVNERNLHGRIPGTTPGIHAKTLYDEQKIEVVKRHFHDYSLQELKELFND